MDGYLLGEPSRRRSRLSAVTRLVASLCVALPRLVRGTYVRFLDLAGLILYLG